MYLREVGCGAGDWVDLAIEAFYEVIVNAWADDTSLKPSPISYIIRDARGLHLPADKGMGGKGHRQLNACQKARKREIESE